MNDLSQLNNMLFKQLEQLQNSSLTGDHLKNEIERSKAFSNVARDVIENSKLALEVQKLKVEYGTANVNAQNLPKMLS